MVARRGSHMKRRLITRGFVVASAVVFTACVQRTNMNIPNQQGRAWYDTGPAPDAEVLPADAPKILPETYFAAGRLFESRSSFVKAAEQYRKAVAVSHQYVDAYNRLGIVLSRLGKFEVACVALAEAVRLRSDSSVLRNNLGYAYMLDGDLVAAEREFAAALEIEPEFYRARVNFGITLARLGRYDEALSQYLAVLPAPDAYYNLGLLYRSDRRYADAASAFAKALEFDPEFETAETHFNELSAFVTVAELESEEEAVEQVRLAVGDARGMALKMVLPGQLEDPLVTPNTFAPSPELATDAESAPLIGISHEVAVETGYPSDTPIESDDTLIESEDGDMSSEIPAQPFDEEVTVQTIDSGGKEDSVSAGESDDATELANEEHATVQQPLAASELSDAETADSSPIIESPELDNDGSGADLEEDVAEEFTMAYAGDQNLGFADAELEDETFDPVESFVPSPVENVQEVIPEGPEEPVENSIEDPGDESSAAQYDDGSEAEPVSELDAAIPECPTESDEQLEIEYDSPTLEEQSGELEQEGIDAVAIVDAERRLDIIVEEKPADGPPDEFADETPTGDDPEPMLDVTSESSDLQEPTPEATADVEPYQVEQDAPLGPVSDEDPFDAFPALEGPYIHDEAAQPDADDSYESQANFFPGEVDIESTDDTPSLEPAEEPTVGDLISGPALLQISSWMARAMHLRWLEDVAGEPTSELFDEDEPVEALESPVVYSEVSAAWPLWRELTFEMTSYAVDVEDMISDCGFLDRHSVPRPGAPQNDKLRSPLEPAIEPESREVQMGLLEYLRVKVTPIDPGWYGSTATDKSRP